MRTCSVVWSDMLSSKRRNTVADCTSWSLPSPISARRVNSYTASAVNAWTIAKVAIRNRARRLRNLMSDPSIPGALAVGHAIRIVEQRDRDRALVRAGPDGHRLDRTRPARTQPRMPRLHVVPGFGHAGERGTSVLVGERVP